MGANNCAHSPAVILLGVFDCPNLDDQMQLFRPNIKLQAQSLLQFERLTVSWHTVMASLLDFGVT